MKSLSNQPRVCVTQLFCCFIINVVLNPFNTVERCNVISRWRCMDVRACVRMSVTKSRRDETGRGSRSLIPADMQIDKINSDTNLQPKRQRPWPSIFKVKCSKIRCLFTYSVTVDLRSAIFVGHFYFVNGGQTSVKSFISLIVIVKVDR